MDKPEFTKHYLGERLLLWILGWAELLDGLGSILTLGIYNPSVKPYLLFSCDWYSKLEEYFNNLR